MTDGAQERGRPIASMKKQENVWNLKGWRCPRCGGVENRSWCLDVNHIDLTACFVIECWSGDLNKESQYHLVHETLSLNPSENSDESL
jgi:hypothetical protein